MNPELELRFVEVETLYKGKQKDYKTKYTISINQIALVEECGNERTKIYMKAPTKFDESNHITINESYKDFMERYKNALNPFGENSWLPNND